jgi:4-aminobutyrate aminotransferase-like enzyme
MAGPATYFDPSRKGELDPATRDLVARRERALGSAYRLFYDEPLQLVRGLGTKVWDAKGTEYLDAYNNVPSVGHAHPRVVAAIAEQAATLNTHTRYLDEGIVAYAEQLLATLPAELETVMFTCTGSEANDLALRVAKLVTGGTGVVVTSNAYHGVTTEIAAISPSLGGMESLAPWVRVVDPANLAGVGAAFDELRAAGVKPAAFIVDTILASDGVIPSIENLADAVAATRERGALFIADEVQPGFGRLGHGMWGFDRYGVSPDLVTVGKPMANGHPVAAVMSRRAYTEQFGRSARYFNTFGGNTVSIAAAQATLDVLRDEGLIENARVIGERLLRDLRAIESPLVAELRGAGLFVGVTLERDGRPATAETLAVVNELRRRRVLLAASGVDNNVLKIRPPLPFDAADAERLVTELALALQGVSR